MTEVVRLSNKPELKSILMEIDPSFMEFSRCIVCISASVRAVQFITLYKILNYNIKTNIFNQQFLMYHGYAFLVQFCY